MLKRDTGKYNYIKTVFRKKYSSSWGTPGWKNNITETVGQIRYKKKLFG
jgi:hypothetical protein